MKFDFKLLRERYKVIFPIRKDINETFYIFLAINIVMSFIVHGINVIKFSSNNVNIALVSLVSLVYCYLLYVEYKHLRITKNTALGMLLLLTSVFHLLIKTIFTNVCA